MRKILLTLLMLFLFPALCAAEGWSLEANGKNIDGAIIDYGVVQLVPLRAVAEALGYTVGWDAATGQVTVDAPIQVAAFKDGSHEVIFTGKLTTINLSGVAEMDMPAEINDGTMYVPAVIFQRFFNEVRIGDKLITIEPSRSELQNN